MEAVATTILNANLRSSELTLKPQDNKRLFNLCGSVDENIKLIENELNVEINYRGNSFTIIGKKQAIILAHELLTRLYAITDSDSALSANLIHLELTKLLNEQDLNLIHEQDFSGLAIKTSKSLIKPQTKNQAKYLENIKQFDINFGIGPAGTGKSFLAVACAVNALESERVERILLVRPAVEAGENLGFLPGDLTQKIDPYLRPLYDALYEMLGFEKVAKLIERNVIEIAPLAYMRGRTLSNAFIILDESQNTTPEQMKMFLTRIGFGSKAVINGDITQIDLPNKKPSGLKQAMKIIDNIPGISFSYFTSKDVVRHKLVQQIIDAYDKHDRKDGDKNA